MTQRIAPLTLAALLALARDNDRVALARLVSMVERGGDSGLAVAGLISLALSAGAAPETTIWFDAPATNFTASCPLGNGRLGAMT